MDKRFPQSDLEQHNTEAVDVMQEREFMLEVDSPPLGMSI